MKDLAPRSVWWLVLMVMVSLPIPFKGIPIPERGAPIAYLAVIGAVLLFCYIGRRASWPLATLLLYSFVRVLWFGVPLRGLQLLLLLAMAGVCYVEAVHLSPVAVRRVAWAVVFGVGVQAALGLLNVFEIYPSPYFLAAPLNWLGLPLNTGQATLEKAFVGRPMGWVTHPNFWGAYLALGLPVVYALLGRWAALVLWALVALSGNIGPVVSASAGLLVMGWRDLPRVLRPALLGVCLVVITIVGIHHLHRGHSHGDNWLSTLSSGRTAVWAASWPNLKEHWALGNGLGSWRYWSEAYNQDYQEKTKQPGVVPATMQAHNEPLQLWFELGLVGLLIGVWWFGSLSWGAWILVRQGDLMWAGVAAAALVNCLGSPTFHMPQQAIVALFAAARLQAASREA